MLDKPTDAWPIGRDGKLNELILLAMIAANSEMGKGWDEAVLKKQADRAADLWQQHIATLTHDPVQSDGEVIEALKSLPVRTLIVNVDTGESGAQSVEVPLDLRDQILTRLTSLSAPVDKPNRNLLAMNNRATIRQNIQTLVYNAIRCNVWNTKEVQNITDNILNQLIIFEGKSQSYLDGEWSRRNIDRFVEEIRKGNE